MMNGDADLDALDNDVDDDEEADERLINLRQTADADGMQDLDLPVSVQTFLWGQIAPFIRPKLGKLHEATCMVCYGCCARTFGRVDYNWLFSLRCLMDVKDEQ